MGKNKSKKVKKFRYVDVNKLDDSVNNSASTSTSDTSGTLGYQKNYHEGGEKSPHIEEERIALTEVASSDAMEALPEIMAGEISHSSKTTSESTNKFSPKNNESDVTYSKTSSSDNNYKTKKGKNNRKHNSNHALPNQRDIEEEKSIERNYVDTTVNADSVQVDIKSTRQDWKVDTNHEMTPDCSQSEEKAKRQLSPDASEFKPKSPCSERHEQAANIFYPERAKKSNISEQFEECQEKKGAKSEIVYSHQQRTEEGARCGRRDGNDNFHKHKAGIGRSDNRSQSRQFVNSDRQGTENDYPQEDSRSNYSNKNRWQQKYKSFNEEGRSRFSSNSRDGDSEVYSSKSKYQRESKLPVGKTDSTSTHNKHGNPENSVSEQNWDDEYHAQPSYEGYEEPQGAANLKSHIHNEAISNRQHDIESISKMNIRDVDNNSTKNIKLATPREVLATPQNSRGLLDPRMKRETERKQPSNEIGQKETSRKQRKSSPSPQAIDRSNYSNKNPWQQKYKSFNEEGRSRFSSNSRDGDSEVYSSKSKYQRESKLPVGKTDSTSTHNKHGNPENSVSEQNWDDEYHAQPSYEGYEEPQGAANLKSHIHNEAISNRQHDIESISRMNIRDVDNNSTKNIKLATPREVLATPQNSRGLLDPRMKRETERKQPSNEIGQKETSRKQRKSSPSPQAIDRSNYSNKNPWQQKYKSFNEEGRSRFSSNSRDGDSEVYSSKSKYQRESKLPVGKTDSTSTHNKHGNPENPVSEQNWDDEYHAQPSYEGYEEPQGAANLKSHIHNEAISNRQHDIESISRMSIRYVDNSTKNIKLATPREVLATPQNSRVLLDPRMKRDPERKQQSNEIWQKETSRKQRKSSPSPQAVDDSERIEKQNKSVLNSEYDSWNDTTNKHRKSFPESILKHETERKSLGGRIERSRKEDFDRSYEKIDVEYREFNEKFRWNTNYNYVKVIEKEQDLFEMSKDYSLGHCVAEDFRMGSGIAVTFKMLFKGLCDLLNQRTKQGGVAVLEDNNRYIYYLVTKRISTGKPTYETFWSSLKKMRDHIISHEVQKLAIPKIGCGLDRLEWAKVKYMIEFLFRDVDIEIVVCDFQQMEDSPQKYSLSTKLVYHYEPLKDIDQYTIILYFSTEDGHVSQDMEELDKKFNFLAGFRRSLKKLGFPVRQEIKEYILYGCIVREKLNNEFDFKSFAKCLYEIDKNNRKDKYYYLALQPVYDENDDLLNEKVITLLRNCLKRVDIYICLGKTPEEQ